MGKEVWIEGRTAYHRKDFTRLRIHDNGCCRIRMNGRELFIYSLFCGFLQILVNGQYEIISRYRFLAAENSHGLAADINLNLLAAVFTAKHLVIDLLYAKFTDDITRFVAFILFLFKLSVVDFTDVAKGMRSHLLQCIVADRLYFDDDTRIIFFLLLDDGDDVCRHILFDADGVKAGMSFDLVPDLVLRHLYQCGKTRDDLGLDRLCQRQERNGKAWTILDEELAVAVIKHTARRHRRDEANAVVVGKFRIIAAIVEL